jgi:nucleotide-binding universal stress UspA family protein
MLSALTRHRQEEACARLTAFVAPVREAGVAVSTAVKEGNPADEILAMARGLPADLLVMGTHGRGGFDRVVLGSTAERMLRKAPCPVLTVPPAAGAREPGRFRRILCATDFSMPAALGVQAALAVAEEAHASLLLVHVIETPAVPWMRARLPAPEPGRGAARENEARKWLENAVSDEARSWCHIEDIVVEGRPHAEIVRLAREREANLVVLGVHGSTAADLMLLGSTAYHVVREAPCAVLTIRGDGHDAYDRPAVPNTWLG